MNDFIVRLGIIDPGTLAKRRSAVISRSSERGKMIKELASRVLLLGRLYYRTWSAFAESACLSSATLYNARRRIADPKARYEPMLATMIALGEAVGIDFLELMLEAASKGVDRALQGKTFDQLPTRSEARAARNAAKTPQRKRRPQSTPAKIRRVRKGPRLVA
ncbi:MAG: hypothetical protein KDD44_12620 [Bdellovibrionales bacterium]|nr:hypothetical protein [Bdellovibrionales bacterium]